MRPDRDRILVEAATTAHRARNRQGRILPHPAWADLSPAGRRRLYEAQLAWRTLERHTDESGLSTTARAVLGRIHRIPQAPPPPDADAPGHDD